MAETFFDQPIKNNLRRYNNIPKIVTDQGDDCTSDYLLDHFYFKNYYKMIAIDLSKKTLNADQKAIQQINSNENIERNENTTMLFIIGKSKENILNFSQRTVRVL